MTAVPKPPKTKKSSRPKRDEFELEEIAEQLTEAMEENKEVILSVWKRDEPVKGKITKMDGNTKLIHIQKLGETLKIPFMDIMKIKNPEY